MYLNELQFLFSALLIPPLNVVLNLRKVNWKLPVHPEVYLIHQMSTKNRIILLPAMQQLSLFLWLQDLTVSQIPTSFQHVVLDIQ